MSTSKPLPRILFVEDSALITDAFVDFLRKDAEVVVARTCAYAFGLVAEDPTGFVMAVLDFHLIGETTEELIPKLRERLGPHVFFIGCSSDRRSRDLQKKLGCDEICEKGEAVHLVYKRLRAV